MLPLCAPAFVNDCRRAEEFLAPNYSAPSAWNIDIGGYGVLEPIYEGSKHCNMTLKPGFEFWQAGEREWLPFPNDAFDLGTGQSPPRVRQGQQVYRGSKAARGRANWAGRN